MSDMAARPYLNLGLRALPLLLFGAIALGGDPVNLNVTNDGIEDIFVTVSDMSTTPYLKVVDHQRMNGFTTIPLAVSADSTGRAHVSWTAISVDSRDRQCGHGEKTGLDNDGTVNVHVDSDCAAW
jgi:hypothetical protein